MQIRAELANQKSVINLIVESLEALIGAFSSSLGNSEIRKNEISEQC